MVHRLPLPLWIFVMSAAGAVAGEPDIDPGRWKITLPLADSRGQALEVTNPQFARYLAKTRFDPRSTRPLFPGRRRRLRISLPSKWGDHREFGILPDRAPGDAQGLGG